MAPVYKTVTLEWHGKKYTIKPTLELINEIENKFSLSRVVSRIAAGDPPISHIATMVGTMLRYAGAQVSDDEVYAELLAGEDRSEEHTSELQSRGQLVCRLLLKKE